MSPERKTKLAAFVANEYKRISSRKFQVWAVASVMYAFALGVYLRTMTRCVWMYYDVLLSMKAGVNPPMEATGSVQIFSNFMKMMSWGYIVICFLYCASNIVDKVVAWKFGNATSTQMVDTIQPAP